MYRKLLSLLYGILLWIRNVKFVPSSLSALFACNNYSESNYPSNKINHYFTKRRRKRAK